MGVNCYRHKLIYALYGCCLVNTFQIITNSFLAMATNAFCGDILLRSRAYFLPGLDVLERMLAQAH
jgi:hypothetical protein